MQNQSVKNLVRAAMFTALIFLGTLLSFPTPAGGNLNFGDGFLLIASLSLGLPWAVLTAAVGAGLADLVSGYVIYLPATILIKGAMALSVVLLQRGLNKVKIPAVIRQLVPLVFAELLMTAGYYFYECILLKSMIAPLVNVPLNLVQGTFAILLAFAYLFGVKHKRNH